MVVAVPVVEERQRDVAVVHDGRLDAACELLDLGPVEVLEREAGRSCPSRRSTGAMVDDSALVEKFGLVLPSRNGPHSGWP